jgi:predicted TIM-barrel fold metal-dependent hydrolase
VLASINFGSFPGFAGSRFFAMKDKDLALATVRAYNDWHFYEWCDRYPGRFIPCGYLPLWDVALAVTELKRLAKLGFRTVSFPDNPAKVGLPSLHHACWNPLWDVLTEERIVISAHIGSGGNAPYASDLSPIDAWITTMPITIANAAADWLFAKFWRDHPDMRICLSEGGIGWIPYLIERADFTVQQHGAWLRSNVQGEKPSDVFKRHFITCFISDKHGLKNRHEIGVERIAWECDYPHSDAVWPESPEYLWNEVKDLPEEEINLMTHGNVMREFRWDPFSILGRENCTVGALRAKALNVDTSPVSRGGLKALGDGYSAVTSADIIKILSHV